MELQSDRWDKEDRIVDYIAVLKDGYEQLEAELAAAFERIAVLEAEVSALTGRQLRSENNADR
jgi:uncharacterized small protein (DUF1192 family)